MTDDPQSSDPHGTEDEDREVAEWSATLDELDARAEASVQSGDPREIAEAHLALAEHLVGIAEFDTIVDLLITAREAYQEFDAVSAARCAVSVGLVAVEVGELDVAYDAFMTSAEEFAELKEWHLYAEAANNTGSIGLRLGDYAAAETALDDAIAVYTDLGLVDEIADVRINLANVYRLSGRPEKAEAELLDLRRQVPAKSLAARACVQSLAGLYAETGRAYLAVPLLEQGYLDAQSDGSEEEVLDARMNTGMGLLTAGHQRRGLQLLEEARQAFVDAGRPDKAAACEYNLATGYALQGDYASSDRAYETAARGLIDAGLAHQAANLQWNRVKRLFLQAAAEPAGRAARTAEAVDTAISALIAADYQRFQFADARRRAEWTELLSHRLTWTFLTAYKMGSKSLMADLIESAVNVGVYGAEGSAAEMVRLDMSPARQISTDFGPDGLAMAMGGAATLLASAVLPQSPPPTLVTASGRTVLGRQRAMVARLDPRLADVLEKVPRVTVW